MKISFTSVVKYFALIILMYGVFHFGRFYEYKRIHQGEDSIPGRFTIICTTDDWVDIIDHSTGLTYTQVGYDEIPDLLWIKTWEE